MAAGNLNDLMMVCGVRNHPTWFSDIELEFWPMEHQMGMVKTYPLHLRYGDFGEPGIGKTFPAQIHAILMAALGNRVLFVMPPKPILQFMREFDLFFHGIRRRLQIEHLDVSGQKKKRLVDEWNTTRWPDILVVSYDTFRQLNDRHGKKKIGPNLWKVRNLAKVGTEEEFSTPYYGPDGTPAHPGAQPYTKDGRRVDKKGRADNPHRMKLYHEGYHVMFFDEAHALCGMDSILSESVCEISRILKDEVAIYLMTGTPIPTHLHDVYGLIRLINPEAYLNKASFMRQHCIMQEFRVALPGGRDKLIRSVKDYQNPEKIYNALWERASRVQKRDVINMPEPIISEYPVRLSGAHEKLYKQVMNDRFAVLGDNVLAPDSVSALRHLGLQLISCPEQFGFTGTNELAEATDELVKTIAPNGDRKVIVFVYYRKAIEELKERYKGYNPSVVYGGTSSSQAEIDRFMFDPNTSMLIINWVSGGAALNLQVASHIIFYECPTSPKDAKQAIARADRKGQVNVVNVYFMRVLNTLSDKNFRNLLKNEKSNNQAIKDRHDLLHELMIA